MYRPRLAAAALLVVGLAACTDDPVAPNAEPQVGNPSFVLNQTDLVSVTAGGRTLQIWPYTAQYPVLGMLADPVNLVLVGDVDPRVLRARLMLLDGERAPFAGLPGADCTWQDAMGGLQAVYNTETGWVAGAIQLACGEYGPTRFHVRFFRLPGMTVAGVHWDLYLPGTTDHAVMSWLLARDFLVYDLMRIGASVAGIVPGITESPTYRTIDDQGPVWASLPPELQGMLVMTGSTDAQGNLRNDGNALIVSVPAMPAEGGTGVFRQELPIAMDIPLYPRPFCTGDGVDYISIGGTVTLQQQIVMTPSGNFTSRFQAKGELLITQVDPLDGAPISETYRARINQHSVVHMNDTDSWYTFADLQKELRLGGADRGTARIRAAVSPQGLGDVEFSISCRP